MKTFLIILLAQLVYSKSYGGYGGGGGGSFSDSGCRNGGPVTKLEVWSGKYVNEIKITYKGGSCGGHGRESIIKGGDYHSFSLDADEKITKIIVRGGTYVDNLQFFTSKNRNTPAYGGSGGSKHTLDFGAEYLSYISGNSGKYVDKIKFFTGGIKFIEYTFDSLNPETEDSKLESLQSLQHENLLNEDTTITLSTSKEVCTTQSYSQTSGFSSTQSASWTGGVPMVSQTKIEISLTETFSWTHGTSTQDCRTITEQIQCPAPPHSTIRGTLTAMHVKATLPFTGTVHFEDGSTSKVSGTWTVDDFDDVDSKCEVLDTSASAQMARAIKRYPWVIPIIVVLLVLLSVAIYSGCKTYRKRRALAEQFRDGDEAEFEYTEMMHNA